MASIDVPVVFINYNRPELTKLVFEEIRRFKPKNLFLISDGPRNDEDKIDVLKVRDIFENIEWECNVFKKYSEVNLGNKVSVEEAFDLVFFRHNFNKAIYLEDDSLPNQSFFTFCEENLKKYQEFDEIVAISGSSELSYSNNYNSYFFSFYPRIQGFATWKRVWSLYEKDISVFWKKNIFSFKFYKKFNSFWEYLYFTNLFNYSYLNLSKKANVWDSNFFSSILCKMREKPISINSYKNLCSNIGFNHYKGEHKVPVEHTKFNNFPRSEINNIVHPNIISTDPNLDKTIFKNFIATYPKNKFLLIIYSLKLLVRSLYSTLRVLVTKKNY
jgi:hypothetical protein